MGNGVGGIETGTRVESGGIGSFVGGRTGAGVGGETGRFVGGGPVGSSGVGAETSKSHVMSSLSRNEMILSIDMSLNPSAPLLSLGSMM